MDESRCRCIWWVGGRTLEYVCVCLGEDLTTKGSRVGKGKRKVVGGWNLIAKFDLSPLPSSALTDLPSPARATPPLCPPF